MKNNKTIGVIVGRFQVKNLHLGHLHIIATALAECDEVVVLLGTQEDFDGRNPYTVKERTATINKIFPQVDIIVMWDQNTDEKWSNNLDIIVNNHCDTCIPTLYYSRDSFINQYKGNIISKREVSEIEGYSGTKIRQIEN